MLKKSFKQRERERREAEILRAAGQIIREVGYASMSMDHLAEAVGISKPTLYQHFRSKEEIIARSVIEAAHEMVAFVESQTDGTPMQKLEAMLRFMIDSMHNPAAFPSSLVTNEVMKVLEEHPDLRAPMTVVQRSLYDWVQAGQAEGEIHPGLPAPMVVMALFKMTDLAEPSRINPVEMLPPDELVEAIVRFFRRGVSPTTPASSGSNG